MSRIVTRLRCVSLSFSRHQVLDLVTSRNCCSFIPILVFRKNAGVLSKATKRAQYNQPMSTILPHRWFEIGSPQFNGNEDQVKKTEAWPESIGDILFFWYAATIRMQPTPANSSILNYRFSPRPPHVDKGVNNSSHVFPWLQLLRGRWFCTLYRIISDCRPPLTACANSCAWYAHCLEVSIGATNDRMRLGGGDSLKPVTRRRIHTSAG